MLKYPISPTGGHFDQDEFAIPEDLKRQPMRQELNRTPEVRGTVKENSGTLLEGFSAN